MSGISRVRAHIEQADPAINAFVALAPETASRPGPRPGSRPGPLGGLTVGVKDCFYDSGRTPTMGSKVHPPPSPVTAAVLERVRASGADVVGYTNLHEWAIGGTSAITATGPIRNPWALDLVAGGSSGGSAAALAAGLVDVAVGTDTGGSIRIPAACCGVVGLKPTQGRVPTGGYVGARGPTDQIGPMGRDVSSVRTLFECLIDEPVAPVDTSSLRIGIARGAPFDNIKPEVRAPYDAALETIAALGTPRDIQIDDWDAQWWANAVLFINHTGTQVATEVRERPEDFDPDALKVLRWGASLAPDLVDAQRRKRDEARTGWARMFEEIDVLVTPTLPSLPPPIARLEVRLPHDVSHADVAFGRLCGPMNLAGVPCLSLPCGLSGDLAVNMSITAASGRDDLVLSFGEAFENATQRAFTNRIAELPGAGSSE